MADLEPVEPPAAPAHRGGAAMTPRPRSTAGLVLARSLVASARWLRTAEPTLRVPVLALAALSAARVAGRVARAAAADAERVRSDAAGRPLVVPPGGAVLRVSWTYVEVRSRR